MANLSTEEALHDVCLLAFIRFVTDLVALEAELLIAVKRVMGVLAAKNAVHAFPLIRTFSCKVPELLAVAAFYGRVGIDEVPGLLVLEL